jgi:AAA+ ATPase superfamily predicted ATPase
MPSPPVAPLFPVGGPVPADLMIGREDEVARVVRQVSQGVSTLVTGPRRIGKTTVCDEVCRRLGEEHDALVVKVDVPERAGGNATALLQLIIDACAALGIADAGGVLRALRPTIEQWLKEHGIPMDLSSVGRRGPMTMREVVDLPLRVAVHQRRRVLLFFDELQRVVDYADGRDVLADLRDVYSAERGQAVVLVDGSDERSIEQLLDNPYNFGKLVSRYDLPTTIAAYLWQNPLVERFAEIGKELADDQRDAIIAFGAGRPYDTMAAARYIALAATGHEDGAVSEFDVGLGLDQARQHLQDDDV